MSVDGVTVSELEMRERRMLLDQVVTVRCADCPWEETGPAREARREWAVHRRDEHDDEAAMSSVERMDAIYDGAKPKRRAPIVASEKKLEDSLRRVRRQGGGVGAMREHGSDTTSGNGSAPARRQAPWTGEEAIAALRTWSEEHGGARPGVADTAGNPALPSSQTLRRLFGSFAAGIEAAGFDRPTRSSRRTIPSSPAALVDATGVEAEPAVGDVTGDGSGHTLPPLVDDHADDDAAELEPEPEPESAVLGNGLRIVAERIYVGLRDLELLRADVDAAKAALRADVDELRRLSEDLKPVIAR